MFPLSFNYFLFLSAIFSPAGSKWRNACLYLYIAWQGRGRWVEEAMMGFPFSFMFSLWYIVKIGDFPAFFFTTITFGHERVQQKGHGNANT